MPLGTGRDFIANALNTASKYAIMKVQEIQGTENKWDTVYADDVNLLGETEVPQ
jgi:hypothetical protein